MNDNVNHPKHYQNGMTSEVECIMFSRMLSFDVGNAFKYVWRAGAKVTETADTDIAKAIWYLKDALNAKLEVSPTSHLLIPFLPKKHLPEWKYETLRCILNGKYHSAIILLTSRSSDTAS